MVWDFKTNVLKYNKKCFYNCVRVGNKNGLFILAIIHGYN